MEKSRNFTQCMHVHSNVCHNFGYYNTLSSSLISRFLFLLSQFSPLNNPIFTFTFTSCQSISTRQWVSRATFELAVHISFRQLWKPQIWSNAGLFASLQKGSVRVCVSVSLYMRSVSGINKTADWLPAVLYATHVLPIQTHCKSTEACYRDSKCSLRGVWLITVLIWCYYSLL